MLWRKLRDAMARAVSKAAAPEPRLPLFRAFGPSIAEDVDRALERYGRQ